MSPENQPAPSQEEELAAFLSNEDGGAPAPAPAEPAPAPAPVENEPAPAPAEPAPAPAPVENEPAPAEPVPAPAPVENESAPAGQQPAGSVPLSADQFRELLDTVRQPQQPTAPQPEPTPEPPRELSLDDFIPEADRPFVEHLTKEWGEVHKGVEVLQRAALQHFQHSLYTQLNGVLAPMLENIQALQVMGHFNAIRQAHNDYEAVLPQVRDWVDSQPNALKAPLSAVLEKGNAQQIIDLIGAFKQATAKTDAAPPPAPSNAQPQANAAPTAAAAAAAAAQAPAPAAVAATAAVTTGSRTAPVETRDPNDFGGALAEALQNVL